MNFILSVCLSEAFESKLPQDDWGAWGKHLEGPQEPLVTIFVVIFFWLGTPGIRSKHFPIAPPPPTVVVALLNMGGG